MKKYVFLCMIFAGCFCFAQDGYLREWMEAAELLKQEEYFDEAFEIYHEVASLDVESLGREDRKYVMLAVEEEKEKPMVLCPGCGRSYIPGSICSCDDVETTAPLMLFPFTLK